MNSGGVKVISQRRRRVHGKPIHSHFLHDCEDNFLVSPSSCPLQPDPHTSCTVVKMISVSPSVYSYVYFGVLSNTRSSHTPAPKYHSSATSITNTCLNVGKKKHCLSLHSTLLKGNNLHPIIFQPITLGYELVYKKRVHQKKLNLTVQQH